MNKPILTKYSVKAQLQVLKANNTIKKLMSTGNNFDVVRTHLNENYIVSEGVITMLEDKFNKG